MTPSLEQCFCPGRFTLLLGGEVGRLVRERFGFRRFKRKMPPSLEQCFCPGRFTLPSEDCFCMFLSSSCRRFFNLKGRSASQGTAHGLQQRWTKPLCWPRCWEKKTLDGSNRLVAPFKLPSLLSRLSGRIRYAYITGHQVEQVVYVFCR